MPINRGPFNALVDDDGSDLVGSIWNKAAIQSVLLDPTDAACSTNYTTVGVGVTDVVFDTPSAQIQYLRVFPNTADITIRSLPSAPPLGTIVIMQNIANGIVWLAHNAPGVAPGTQLSNRVTSGPTPLAVGGSAIYVREYEGAGWHLMHHDQGRAIAVPYGAANYNAGGTTWTVPQASVVEHSYFIHGDTVRLRVNLVTTTISGSAATTLSIYGWPTWTFKDAAGGAAGTPGWTSLSVGGAWGLMQAYPVAANALGFIRPDYAAWPNTAGVGYFGYEGTWRLL